MSHSEEITDRYKEPISKEDFVLCKSSVDFEEVVKDAHINSNWIVSLDIVNLLTRKSADEARSVVWDKLESGNPMIC